MSCCFVIEINYRSLVNKDKLSIFQQGLSLSDSLKKLLISLDESFLKTSSIAEYIFRWPRDGTSDFTLT